MGLSRDKVKQLEKRLTCEVSDALVLTLENPWEYHARTSDRTQSASGLQGSQPLVARGRQVREVGKFGP